MTEPERAFSADLPAPLVVFRDDGGYALLDGNHRITAAKRIAPTTSSKTGEDQ